MKEIFIPSYIMDVEELDKAKFMEAILQFSTKVIAKNIGLMQEISLFVLNVERYFASGIWEGILEIPSMYSDNTQMFETRLMYC